VVFGLSDGRVFVYKTEKALRPDLAQWPTPNGGPRHTGAWRPASQSPPEQPK
jgi:hypothetical protein